MSHAAFSVDTPPWDSFRCGREERGATNPRNALRNAPRNTPPLRANTPPSRGFSRTQNQMFVAR